MKMSRFDSADTNVCKYVFEFQGDRPGVAEAVLYRYGSYAERTVICCSVQSGCPVGCTFCGTGEQFIRNLTADEIVGQVMSVMADKEIDPSVVKKGQIMFMSMGEPFLNAKNMVEAITRLHEMYPTFQLLVSTMGPKGNYEPFFELAKKVSKVGLQFSVHESTEEARGVLIPFKKKLSLTEIAALGQRFFDETGRNPFINYCVHTGNSSDADADRLEALFNPMVFQATLSVICESDESVAASHIRQVDLVEAFSQKLLGKGFSTRCFDPAGQDDIGGGCGQLWYTQEWMKNHKREKCEAS